jgi:twinkle protein
MYFLKYHGSTPLAEVITALEQSVYTLDVQHIILDNLQFMTSGQASRKTDKFDLQEEAIHALRNFASKYNVHVTLVVHPRKESEGLPLEIYSVFGSGKVIQEADNVIIIQQAPEGRYIEVKKNRCVYSQVNLVLLVIGM